MGSVRVNWPRERERDIVRRVSVLPSRDIATAVNNTATATNTDQTRQNLPERNVSDV